MAILVDMSHVHVPVLAAELIDVLDPRPGETAVDATFGAGGHAALVADRIGPEGLLIGLDRDPIAREHAARLRSESATPLRFEPGPFAETLEHLVEEGVRADVVYLDLGISSMQVDARERGFAYAYDAPLDMRMDPTADIPTAADLVNEWDARRLARTFKSYADERHATQIARAIVRRRERQGPFETTQELVATISDAIPARLRFAGGHPAKRTFQALRIAVNDELGQLDAALPAAWALLRPGGRLGVISFHSLEDRRVKRFLVDRATGCICPPDLPVCACGRQPEAELLTRRSVVPSAGEVAHNPRSGSARLRAARKVSDPEDQG